MKYLIALLCIMSSLTAGDQKWERFKHKVLLKQKNIPGWCVYEKADKLMNLIHDTHPQVVVEIGVYGGSSVYPMAEALKYQKSGVIYAIDPWMPADCQVGYDDQNANAVWWGMLDHDKIYKGFVKLIKENHLSKYCMIRRLNSEQALPEFADESIDIVHIDGNHSEEASMRDVLIYLPKVKKGGYLWFDDANWPDTQKTVFYLKQNLTLIPELCIGQECLLFQKP